MEGVFVMKKSGIYEIRNTVNGMVYVGSSSNLIHRFAQHRWMLRNNNHYNNNLQSSWNIFGEVSFSFKILEICEKELLIDREQFYMDKLRSVEREFGFNIDTTKGFSEEHLANSSRVNMGKIIPQETRDKISIALKGRKHSDCKPIDPVRERELGRKREQKYRQLHKDEIKQRKSEYNRERYRKNKLRESQLSNII